MHMPRHAGPRVESKPEGLVFELGEDDIASDALTLRQAEEQDVDFELEDDDPPERDDHLKLQAMQREHMAAQAAAAEAVEGDEGAAMAAGSLSTSASPRWQLSPLSHPHRPRYSAGSLARARRRPSRMR